MRVTGAERDMLRLWRLYAPPAGRISGMAAGLVPVVGHLPESGGAGEQAAIMLDAFDVMSAMQAELEAAQRS